MIAAIYARKSTDQSGVADEQKSVRRQIDSARAYAKRKGWRVDDAQIFLDDGISGAEFANRPGFVRLMNALKPTPRFQVLIVSELSRIGREQLETGYACKQLAEAGVRIFSYLEDRELVLDSPTDVFLMSALAFAADVERAKARERTYDALARKVKAGHLAGGRTFGYDNVEVMGANGMRSHVVQHVNPEEAKVVCRIFELAATGYGQKRIARQLNADGALAPRSQRRRPQGWAPSSVRECLHRETYRGRRVWNKTKKRDRFGKRKQQDVPQSKWMTIEAPDLRIVPESLWQAAHKTLTTRRANAKQHIGDGRGIQTKYFLSGHGRCAVCGSSMVNVSRSSSRGRSRRYVCGTYWGKGPTVCSNGVMAASPEADQTVFDLLTKKALALTNVENVIMKAVRMLTSSRGDAGQRALTQRLAAVEHELENLTDTAARGGAVPAVLSALAARDDERRQLVEELRQQESAHAPIRPEEVRARLRVYLAEFSSRYETVAEARPLLDFVLADRIEFRPNPAGFELTIRVTWERVFQALMPTAGNLQKLDGVPTRKRPAFETEYRVILRAA